MKETEDNSSSCLLSCVGRPPHPILFAVPSSGHICRGVGFITWDGPNSQHGTRERKGNPPSRARTGAVWCAVCQDTGHSSPWCSVTAVTARHRHYRDPLPDNVQHHHPAATSPASSWLALAATATCTATTRPAGSGLRHSTESQTVAAPSRGQEHQAEATEKPGMEVPRVLTPPAWMLLTPSWKLSQDPAPTSIPGQPLWGSLASGPTSAQCPWGAAQAPGLSLSPRPRVTQPQLLTHLLPQPQLRELFFFFAFPQTQIMHF